MGRLTFDLLVVCIAIALSAIWLSLMAYGNGMGNMGGSTSSSYSSLISCLPILYAILIAVVTMMHVELKGYVYTLIFIIGTLLITLALPHDGEFSDKITVSVLIGFPVLIWAGSYSSCIFTENEEDDRDRTPHR